MPQIVLWSWELAPDLSPAKARAAYREVLKSDPCSYCGGFDERPVVDHIESQASLADDLWTNLTAACRRCNASKSDRDFLGFLLGVRLVEPRFGRRVTADKLSLMRARRVRAAEVEALVAA
jgi:hypothetical protein